MRRKAKLKQSKGEVDEDELDEKMDDVNLSQLDGYMPEKGLKHRTFKITLPKGNCGALVIVILLLGMIGLLNTGYYVGEKAFRIDMESDERIDRLSDFELIEALAVHLIDEEKVDSGGESIDPLKLYETLKAYYKVHNEERLPDLPNILVRYEGRLPDLFQKLESKYGVHPMPGYRAGETSQKIHAALVDGTHGVDHNIGDRAMHGAVLQQTIHSDPDDLMQTFDIELAEPVKEKTTSAIETARDTMPLPSYIVQREPIDLPVEHSFNDPLFGMQESKILSSPFSFGSEVNQVRKSEAAQPFPMLYRQEEMLFQSERQTVQPAETDFKILVFGMPGTGSYKVYDFLSQYTSIDTALFSRNGKPSTSASKHCFSFDDEDGFELLASLLYPLSSDVLSSAADAFQSQAMALQQVLANLAGRRKHKKATILTNFLSSVFGSRSSEGSQLNELMMKDVLDSQANSPYNTPRIHFLKRKDICLAHGQYLNLFADLILESVDKEHALFVVTVMELDRWIQHMKQLEKNFLEVLGKHVEMSAFERSVFRRSLKYLLGTHGFNERQWRKQYEAYYELLLEKIPENRRILVLEEESRSGSDKTSVPTNYRWLESFLRRHHLFPKEAESSFQAERGRVTTFQALYRRLDYEVQSQDIRSSLLAQQQLSRLHKRSTIKADAAVEYIIISSHAQASDIVGDILADMLLPGHINSKNHARVTAKSSKRILAGSTANIYFDDYFPSENRKLIYISLPVQLTQQLQAQERCIWLRESLERQLTARTRLRQEDQQEENSAVLEMMQDDFFPSALLPYTERMTERITKLASQGSLPDERFLNLDLSTRASEHATELLLSVVQPFCTFLIGHGVRCSATKHLASKLYHQLFELHPCTEA